jgi:hypothetical protein
MRQHARRARSEIKILFAFETVENWRRKLRGERQQHVKRLYQEARRFDSTGCPVDKFGAIRCATGEKPSSG